MKDLLISFSGPSSSGKSTLLSECKKKYKNKFESRQKNNDPAITVKNDNLSAKTPAQETRPGLFSRCALAVKKVFKKSGS